MPLPFIIIAGFLVAGYLIVRRVMNYVWPIDIGSFRISSKFGTRQNPLDRSQTQFHPGVDLAAPTGTPVCAISGGIVTDVSDNLDKTRGYGHRVVLTHDDGFVSTYNHLDERYVDVGYVVAKGDEIGAVGSTGASTGAHLHFEILDPDGNFMDPLERLPKSIA